MHASPGRVMAQVGLLEDNTRIAKLCATLLHYAGHHVTIYEHPFECLRALLPPPMPTIRGIHLPQPMLPSSSLVPIDVLVLDLHLPEMDGIEVLEYLRAYSHTQFLPLVFCTAASQAEIARAMRLAPHATFVEKPFKLQTLTDAITKVLNAEVK